MSDEEKKKCPVNEDGFKVNPSNNRVYGKSALTTRDEDRDKVTIKKKKRGRKGLKNKILEITDEMREDVMIWAAGKASVETIAKLLQTEVKTVKNRFVSELKQGKDICLAKVQEKIYRQAVSNEKNALTAQSQKIFMQNIGDWSDKSGNLSKDSTHGGDTDKIMDGMTEVEKFQRALSISKSLKLMQGKDKKSETKEKEKPKTIEFN